MAYGDKDKFYSQRICAGKRGIAWNITFDEWFKFTATCSEVVLVAFMPRGTFSNNQASFFQGLKTLAQQSRRYTGQAALEFVVTRRSQKQLAQDQHRPSFTDDVTGFCHRAELSIVSHLINLVPVVSNYRYCS